MLFPASAMAKDGMRSPGRCTDPIRKDVLLRSASSPCFLSSKASPLVSSAMKIVGILGSPSVSSRSGTRLNHAQAALQDVATRLRTITVRELPAEALLHAQFDHPLIRQALHQVHEAQVVLVSTPIYKAAYSGLLEAFLDLLPQEGLREKTVIPLAAGGSIAHLLALDYALKPVLSALGARDILDPVFATDLQIPKHDTEGYRPLPEVEERLARTLQTVIARNDEFLRQEDAARERAALLSRLQAPAPGDSLRWASGDVRWSN